MVLFRNCGIKRIKFESSRVSRGHVQISMGMTHGILLESLVCPGDLVCDSSHAPITNTAKLFISYSNISLNKHSLHAIKNTHLYLHLIDAHYQE